MARGSYFSRGLASWGGFVLSLHGKRALLVSYGFFFARTDGGRPLQHRRVPDLPRELRLPKPQDACSKHVWWRTWIVCKVGRMLVCCTGAGTHNFQIASERVQYRLKWHVLGHIRPPSTLQNVQYSIPGTCVQYPGLQGGGALGDALTPGTPAGSMAANAHGGHA